jgi:hypothetical protein
MKAEVQKWYNEGSNFYKGVMLLRSVGASTESFESLLNESYIPTAKRQLLEAAINALCNRPFAIIRQLAQIDEPKRNNRNSKSDGEPPVITAMRDKAKLLHKLHADQHAQLHAATDDEQRLPIILSIMEDIIPQLDDLYDQIRAYQSDGVLPNETVLSEKNYETGVKEGIEKFQRLINLKSRISKLDGKNGLISQERNAQRKATLEKELTEKRLEMDTIQAEINLQ